MSLFAFFISFFFLIAEQPWITTVVCVQFRLELIPIKKVKAKTLESRLCPRRYPVSLARIQFLLGRFLFALVAIPMHYVKSASVPVPAFDANAKCFGGGWFKAVRCHESRDCTSGHFPVTCPRRISLGFATTLEEESRINPGTGLVDLSLASSPGAVSRDLSTNAFIPQYLCCRRDRQGGYYSDARNFAEEVD